jgi:hypothetical protein
MLTAIIVIAIATGAVAAGLGTVVALVNTCSCARNSLSQRGSGWPRGVRLSRAVQADVRSLWHR